jgi:hypothetical protein
VAHKSESLRIWQNWSRPILDDLFSEAASRKIELMPDTAVAEMEEILKSVFEETSTKQPDNSRECLSQIRRMDAVALRCDSHHYAVDLFYRTYHPHTGAPSLSVDYLDMLLTLESQGLNKIQIAEKLGAKTKDEIKTEADRIRKAIKTARKLYKQKVEEIQELGSQQWEAMLREPKKKSQK